MATRRLFLIAGERSGDTHGAGLIAAWHDLLATNGDVLEVRGLGGAKLKAVAPLIEDWVDRAGVVGLWEVIKQYGYFRHHFHRVLDAIMEAAPEAVVLVDYPGFNLRLAEALRRKGYQGKLLYYISPQVWAWKKSRIPRMAEVLDLMVCLFPFEVEVFQASGLKTVFAGHPLIDRVAAFPREARDVNLAGLFPGSRRMEVQRLFPLMLEAATTFGRRYPDWKFAVPAASTALAGLMRQMAETLPDEMKNRVLIQEGGSQELMRTCRAGLVASGTATLEASCWGMPYALVYRVSWLTWEVGRRLVKIPFLGMANILAGRPVIRELIQGECTAASMAKELELLMTDEHYRAKVEAGLKEAVACLGDGGAYERAAGVMWESLEPGKSGVGVS